MAVGSGNIMTTRTLPYVLQAGLDFPRAAPQAGARAKGENLIKMNFHFLRKKNL